MLTLGRVSLSRTTCGIVLAGFSGKGMAAALLMAATRAILRSLVKLDPRPGRILMQLNQTLMEDLPIGNL
jgi:sigma-B regulation protein RsbU (phosphoserine phosphatase)